MARGRRVRRVLRKIDTWSVLKVSALFHLTLVFVLLVAGVLLWAVGSSVGAIHSIEKFMRSIGFEGFHFVGGQLLRGFAAFGVVLVVVGTGLSVLVAVVYNLISDVVGGIQYVVLEEAPGPPAAVGHNGAAVVAVPGRADAPTSPAVVAAAAGAALAEPEPEPVLHGPSSEPSAASDPLTEQSLPATVRGGASSHNEPDRPGPGHETALAPATSPSRPLPWSQPRPEGDGAAPLNGARTLESHGSFDGVADGLDPTTVEADDSETPDMPPARTDDPVRPAASAAPGWPPSA